MNEKWCDIESIACDRVFTTIQWSMIYSISLAAPIVIQSSQQWINYNCPVSNIETPKMIFFCIEWNNWFVCVAFRSNRIENYLFCFSLALSRDWKQTHAKTNTIKWNKLSRLFSNVINWIHSLNGCNVIDINYISISFSFSESFVSSSLLRVYFESRKRLMTWIACIQMLYTTTEQPKMSIECVCVSDGGISSKWS